MTTYIAIFKIRLPCPIAVGESSLPDLTVNPSSGYLKRALLRVSPVNGAITEVTVWATYSHDSLRHCVVAGQTEMDGVAVVGEAGRLVPPWEIAHSIIRPLLYQISAVTLQAHVFWDMEDGLTKWITAFTWTLPDGRVLPSIPLDYPGKAIRVLTDTGERSLMAGDWVDLQRICDGHRVTPPPLWRSILAQAHRDRTNDLRNTVIHAATALDIGCQPFLPAGRKFNMSVFRSEGVRSGDLRLADPPLYKALSRLWFTRHAAIHRGEWQLYDKNPQDGARPLRAVVARDVEEFLTAVPKGIAYLHANPP